jgi:Fungal fruit body lectin
LRFGFRKRTKASFVRINADKIENLEALWIRRADNHQVYFSERYLADFDAVPGVHNPRKSYIFLVKRLALQASSGYTLAKAFPERWEGMEEGMRLVMDHGGANVGVLLFQNKMKKKGFLVLLGMGKYNPWCDIVPDIQDETLVEAIKPYVDSTATDPKQNRKALDLDRVYKDLSDHGSAFVAVRKGRMGGEVQYFVDITVKVGDDISICSRPRVTKADLPKVSDSGQEIG